ncbi:MAG: phenylacetate--CoA ligase family protein [Bacilli bacterium]
MMTKLQRKHFEPQVDHIRSPFYLRKWGEMVSGTHVFGALPYTEKDELVHIHPFDLLNVSKTEVAGYQESSGTSGKRSVAWYTEADYNRNGIAIANSAVQLRSSDSVLIRFPYALSVPAQFVQRAAVYAGATVVPASSRNTIVSYSRAVALVHELEVTVIAGLPRELELMGYSAHLTGQRIDSVRAVIVAGELLTPARQRKLSQLWNVPVINLYGATELGNIAAMGPCGKLHINEQHYWVEVLDSDGKLCSSFPKIGEAVITTLAHKASPLVRYRTGDRIQLMPSTCNCEMGGWTMEHFGRMNETYTVQGHTLTHYDLQQAILNLSITPIAWQFQVGDQFTFYFEPQNTLTSYEQQTLTEELQQTFHHPCRLVFVPPGEFVDRTLLTANDASRKPNYFVR